MTNVKIKKLATWLLLAVFAAFSLTTVACTNTSTDEKAGSNNETPDIGAPSDVIGNINLGNDQGSSTSSEQILTYEEDHAAVSYGSPNIAPLSMGASEGFGQAFTSSVGATNSGIWVTGQGIIEIPADIAQLSIGVESRETTVSAARQEAANTMEKVLDAIKENGVSEDDIVTTNLNIYPQTIWVEVSDSLGRHSEPRIIGYTVSNTVQVTVRDIDNLSPVVDTAATAGGDLIRINSIQFTVDDSSAYGEKIRQHAAADALAKADVYALAMGVTLGELVYLTEISSSVPMSYDTPMAEMAAMDRAFKSTPISSGDVNLSVTIQAVFAIGG